MTLNLTQLQDLNCSLVSEDGSLDCHQCMILTKFKPVLFRAWITQYQDKHCSSKVNQHGLTNQAFDPLHSQGNFIDK